MIAAATRIVASFDQDPKFALDHVLYVRQHSIDSIKSKDAKLFCRYVDRFVGLVRVAGGIPAKRYGNQAALAKEPGPKGKAKTQMTQPEIKFLCKFCTSGAGCVKGKECPCAHTQCPKGAC